MRGCKKDCTERNALCHGKNPDGSWRCSSWGEAQDAIAARKDEDDRKKRAEIAVHEYRSESYMRYIKRKKRHHRGGEK